MNNIKTQSYLVKRLKDSGYEVWKMMDAYAEQDPRKFTLLIDPKNCSVWLTCYENLEEEGDVWFGLDDGGQFIPNNIKLKTDSFEVLANYLHTRGIIKKYDDVDNK